MAWSGRAAPAVARRLEGLGFAVGTRKGQLFKALGHARLPAWTCSLPLREHLWRQPQADHLFRVGRPGAASLLEDGTSEHLVRHLREFFVLFRLDDVRIDALEVRAQSTARSGLVHDRSPSSC